MGDLFVQLVAEAEVDALDRFARRIDEGGLAHEGFQGNAGASPRR